MSNKRALEYQQGLGAGKKIRREENVHVVPDIDNGHENVERNSGEKIIIEVPKPGTNIDRRVLRKAGPFIIGPELRHNHNLLGCMVQHLARKENSDQFFQIKVSCFKLSLCT